MKLQHKSLSVSWVMKVIYAPDEVWEQDWCNERMKERKTMGGRRKRGRRWEEEEREEDDGRKKKERKMMGGRNVMERERGGKREREGGKGEKCVLWDMR